MSNEIAQYAVVNSENGEVVSKLFADRIDAQMVAFEKNSESNSVKYAVEIR